MLGLGSGVQIKELKGSNPFFGNNKCLLLINCVKKKMLQAQTY